MQVWWFVFMLPTEDINSMTYGPVRTIVSVQLLIRAVAHKESAPGLGWTVEGEEYKALLYVYVKGGIDGYLILEAASPSRGGNGPFCTSDSQAASCNSPTVARPGRKEEICWHLLLCSSKMPVASERIHTNGNASMLTLPGTEMQPTCRSAASQPLRLSCRAGDKLG